MDATAKQQVIERIKQAQNILVTVSTNPSVDQLAACIGFTLLLNKLNKHATAVFSGSVPSTLEFLQPDKTIETNTDSLRDFIISLDKNKADKLRYKVEDDVVKIFITPYRTSLTDKDLVFSQGDYNVEAVVALGVKDKTQLDAAITSHGRILHDATVISVNSGEGKAPDIGQINWHEPTASSLSEMLVSISESFGANLLDGQMATAFLTGIVAETQRFSNQKTSPKVMTMSAQLMAAGANQQLIVSKLDTPVATSTQPAKVEAKPAATESADGTLTVTHDKEPEEPEVPKPAPPVVAAPPKEPAAKEEQVAKEQPAEKAEPLTRPSNTPVQAKDDEVDVSSGEIHIDDDGNIHSANDSDSEDEMPGSHTLLNPTDKAPLMETAFTANTQPGWDTSTEMVNPFSEDDHTPSPSSGFLTHGPTIAPPDHSKPTVPKAAEPQKAPSAAPHVDQARNAVESAFASAPFDPALSPVEALNAAPLPVEPPKAEVKDEIKQPAPPPLPPPIVPSPGIIIPPPFMSTGSPVQKKIDEQTL